MDPVCGAVYRIQLLSKQSVSNYIDLVRGILYRIQLLHENSAMGIETRITAPLRKRWERDGDIEANQAPTARGESLRKATAYQP